MKTRDGEKEVLVIKPVVLLSFHHRQKHYHRTYLQRLCSARAFQLAVVRLTARLLSLDLGIMIGLQKTIVHNTSIMNDAIVTHTNIVFFQYHNILLNRGSSDARVKDVSYNSGIPAPGRYSARCSIVTFKQAVGTTPSLKPLNLTVRV